MGLSALFIKAKTIFIEINSKLFGNPSKNAMDHSKFSVGPYGFILCLVLGQPRKIGKRPDITEQLLPVT